MDQQPTRLVPIGPFEIPGSNPTTVYLEDLADKIYNHINEEYSSEEINKIAEQLSQNPISIGYNRENPEEKILLPNFTRLLFPGVDLFNEAVQMAMTDYGPNVTKKKIILILCNRIRKYARDRSAWATLRTCQICRDAAASSFQTPSGGKKKDRRSRLKSHRNKRKSKSNNKKKITKKKRKLTFIKRKYNKKN